MTSEDQARKIKRVLRVGGKTAAELGVAIGYDKKSGGRTIGRTLKQMVEVGDAVKLPGRPPKYAKAT